MSENKKLNSHWKEAEEGKDFHPWNNEDDWLDVGYSCYKKGSDFCLPDGRAYGVDQDGCEETQYQRLRVHWVNNSGRAAFGYCVRNKDTKEIVAVINQGHAWSWWFRLKYVEISQYQDENGWVRENLFANTMNSVFCRLVPEKDEK